MTEESTGGEQRAVKPCAELSGTNWLTTARDAEPGMDLVVKKSGKVMRAEILEVAGDWIVTESFGEVSIDMVDKSPYAVVE